jgi:hypothetical protein
VGPRGDSGSAGTGTPATRTRAYLTRRCAARRRAQMNGIASIDVTPTSTCPGRRDDSLRGAAADASGPDKAAAGLRAGSDPVNAAVLLDASVRIWGSINLEKPVRFTATVAPITVFNSLRQVFPSETWPYNIVSVCSPVGSIVAVSKQQASPSWPATLRTYNAAGTAVAAAVTVPAGAVSSAVEISASQVQGFAFAAADVFAAATTATTSYSAVGSAVRLLPHGTTFSKSATVTVQLPAGLDVGGAIACGSAASATVRRGLVVLRKPDDAASSAWAELSGLNCTQVQQASITNSLSVHIQVQYS